MTRAAGLVFAVLLVLGCRTPVGPPSRPPLQPVFGEEARMATWVERAGQEAEGRTGVRAIGHLRVSSPSGSGRVKQVIIAERPSRLRLESINFLGQTESLLVTDGVRYALYNGGKIERGGVSAHLLRQYMGLDVEPAEAVALLVAAPELPAGTPRAVFAQGPDRVVEFAAERVRFGPDGQFIGVEALHPGGQVRFEAEYDRWREVSGGRYPYAVAFHFPMSELSAELDLDEVELNPTLDASLFTLP